MKGTIFITIWKQRVIIAFVLVALVLWYVSRLSHQYTTQIPIDIEIVTDFKSDVWIEECNMTIDATVKSDGRLLLFYQLGAIPRVKIDASQLKFNKTETPYQYTMDPVSLRRALQNNITDMTINFVNDSLNTVTLARMMQKRLPLKNNITLKCKRQYMVVGGVKLSFDSIDVKAPQIILDTLNSIPTKPLHLSKLVSSISGTVALVIPDNVLTVRNQVNYRAEITGFTEMQFHLPITVQNMPRNTNASIIPNHTTIKVRVPLDKFSRAIRPYATINYNYIDSDRRSTMFPVKIDSLPKGADLIFMDPQFVEPFFQHR